MLRLASYVFVSVVLSACVANVPLARQSPQPEYSVPGRTGVAVVDERQRVKDGKKPTFVGVAHGAFGIPANWHVKPVLAVEPGDKERNLAQFLEYRVVGGLRVQGWDTQGADFKSAPSEIEAQEILSTGNFDTLLLLRIREWFFRLNLNWVTAFNFDTDTLVEVYKSGRGLVLQKVFAGRDVIDEDASQSPRNHILLAYKAQLDEIVNDREVREALTR